MFDKDNDGTISIDELPAVLRYLGQNPSQKMVQEIMAEIDIDGERDARLFVYLSVCLPVYLTVCLFRNFPI